MFLVRCFSLYGIEPIFIERLVIKLNEASDLLSDHSNLRVQAKNFWFLVSPFYDGM